MLLNVLLSVAPLHLTELGVNVFYNELSGKKNNQGPSAVSSVFHRLGLTSISILAPLPFFKYFDAKKSSAAPI